MDLKQLGFNIKQARKNAKLTQDQLCEKLGYNSKMTISNWETGKADISICNLHRFCKLVGITLQELLKNI